MKPITVYEANDGSRWDDPNKASERDSLIHEIYLIMAPLPEVKDDASRFANGNGYVQRDAVIVERVRADLLVPTKRILKWWWDGQMKDHGKEPVDAHPSWYLRILDGTAAPLERAWSRLCCIDKSYREWGQPFYAAHPEKGEQVEWALTP